MDLKNKIRRYMFASNVVVKPYSSSMFKKIDVPMEHRAPHEDYGDDKSWEDTEFNYRLDAPVEEIYYAFTKGKVIGHLGLNGEDVIIAVYVSPKYRRKGVSAKMHEEVFNRNTKIFSDDPSAMESEEKSTWEKLMKKLPGKIKKQKDESFIYEA